MTTNSPPFEDDQLFDQLREIAPTVPADVLSVSGPTATRVLGRARRITGPDPQQELYRGSRRRTARRPSWRRWAMPRRAWIPSLAVAVVAIAAALIVSGGIEGGPSIVARAYAATAPDGVIVHYIVTQRSTLAHAPTQISEFWTLDHQTRERSAYPSYHRVQNEVFQDGQGETLMGRRLIIYPSWPADTRCGAALVLVGGCAPGIDNAPVDAIRSLLRSGSLRPTGNIKVNGDSVQVLTGTAPGLGGEVRIRALVNTATSLPMRIQITWTLPHGHAAHAVVETFTITNYERLPLTPRNRQLVQLPPHPKATVFRLHRCPTRRDRTRLCPSGSNSTSLPPVGQKAQR